MTRRLCAVVLLVLGVLALPAAPAQAATKTVTIRSTLNPKSLTVAPGTTVTWRNDDSDRHRIRTTSGPVELDSNDLERGESWSFTFRTAGTYRYVDHRDEDDSAYWGTVTVSSGSSGGSGGSTGGGSTGGSTGGSAGGSTGGSTGGGASTAPSSGSVSIVDRAFSPSSIRVAAGGTITFTNSDDRPHTVTANDGSFDSGIMNAGARYARRFATAGTYRYFCAVHPEMTGTVTVPTATGSVPAAKPAARGGSAGGSTGAGSGGSGIAAPPPIPSASAASIRVNVIDFAFDPAKATARVGDTISWVNTGRAPHTVTPSGGSFGTSMLAAGATYRTVAKKTGTFAYVCAFHPQMTGTLVVLPKSAALPKNDAPAPKPVVASATPAVPPPGAAPAAPAAPVEQAAARRSVRPVATSWTDSPLALWSLGSGWALLLFLALAWWRHQEPKGGRERG